MFRHTIEMLTELTAMAFLLYAWYAVWCWTQAFEPLATYAQ